MKKQLLLCILVVALAAPAISFAQGIPSAGSDFYLGFLYPSFNNVVPAHSAGYTRIYAYVSSFEDNTVSISYFDQLTKKEEAPANYTVLARSTRQIVLDQTKMHMKDPGDIDGEFKSVHITSRKPITVQYFSTGANSGGSYLALPVNAWGKKYVVASYNDNGHGDGAWIGGSGATQFDPAGGYFMVIAAYNDTKVTIIPTAMTGGGHPGVNQGPKATGTPQPYTVTLARGQCYLVKSQSALKEGEDDISASIVKANKPVAVIAGHEDANVGDGTTDGRNLEARDHMVEQMIPVEYWDNTGYITIPRPDSPSNNGHGVGDDIRFYVSDTLTAQSILLNDGTVSVATDVYIAPPGDRTNVIAPTHYYSADNTKRFSVMQYDLTNHGTGGAPFPRPSMMTIVPRSSWGHAYLWYVPTNVNEKLQAYYITVIGLKDGTQYKGMARNWFSDSIRVSVNGSNTFTRISQIGAQKATWNTIPGHADLRAVTYQVGPGTSYYVKAPFPFMVYQYGMRGFDASGALGDFNNTDYFFSYGLPVGMALHNAPHVQRLKVDIDSGCAEWNICITDSNDPGGIRSIMLLDDPRGDIILGGNYRSNNVSLEYQGVQRGLEITPEGSPRNICVKVRVENPGFSARAALYIIDVNGKGRVVQLAYEESTVKLIPDVSEGLSFTTPYVGEEMCQDYLFINTKESQRSYLVSKVELPIPTHFTISSITPSVGSSIKPGDTLRIRVCFTAQDTFSYADSIDLTTDCFSARLPLFGKAGTGLITAHDADFGTLLTGSERCKDIPVTNIGNKPFTLDKNWVLASPSKAFTFDTTLAQNKLPLTLNPGDTQKFRFCYKPTDKGSDSARMTWSTNIAPPYDKSVKTYSFFLGNAIAGGLFWDRATELMTVSEPGDDTIHRVNLTNTGTGEGTLSRIWIDGPDADEFSVVRTEFNTNPPTYAGTVLAVGDTMWVDVKFTHNASKTPLTRTRLAYLRTAGTVDTGVRTIELFGRLGGASVGDKDDELIEVTLRPNPARDRIALTVGLESAGDVTVEVFDILGRSVTNRMFNGYSAGAQTMILQLPRLADGMYYVRVRANGRTRTLPIEIRKQ